MAKRYSNEERFLLLAGARYAEATGISKQKIAWVFASLMGRTDNAVCCSLREAAERVARVPQEDWDLFDYDEEPEDPLEQEAQKEVEEVPLEQQVGDVVSVKVVNVRTFGALCQVIGSTRTLLLHVSEIADEYIHDVTDYVSEGDTFLAMLVLSKANNRLALSAKRIKSLKNKRAVRFEAFA